MIQKLVVTGALGHIGSYFIRFIGSRFPNLHIVMFDNLSTQRFYTLFDLPTNANYHFVEGDVRDFDLNTLFEGNDAIIHLAALTDATSSFKNANLIEDVNLGGTERVSKTCASLGIPLIALSSTSVYGTQSETVDETCPNDQLMPQSPYAESKLREEMLLTELAQTKNLRHIVCRFGTIFGVAPGMRFHTAVNKFCWQAVMGQPLSVWRTALTQKRPYLDIVDASSALAFILERNVFDGQIYNVVTQNAAVVEITDIIQSVLPMTKIELVDSTIMNQLSYEVSAKRINNLGFKFKGNIETAIRETITLLQNANYKTKSSVFPGGG